MKHPHWPAGAPDSKGGQFRPKDESDAVIIPVARPRWPKRQPPPKSSVPEHPLDPRGDNSGDPPEPREPPNIPEEPPPPDERYDIVKEIAGDMEDALAAGARAWVRNALLDAARIAWLSQQPTNYYYQLLANLDPPKPLQELQDGVYTPALGYHNHHIVERQPALDDEFPESWVDSHDNIVQIPEMKHRLITEWYQTPNPDYGWLTPRNYLLGKRWAQRWQVGISALIKFGVLEQ